MFYCRIDYAAIADVEETKLYGFHAEFTVLTTWEIKLFSSVIMLAKYIVFLITYWMWQINDLEQLNFIRITSTEA